MNDGESDGLQALDKKSYGVPQVITPLRPNTPFYRTASGHTQMLTLEPSRDSGQTETRNEDYRQAKFRPPQSHVSGCANNSCAGHSRRE